MAWVAFDRGAKTVEQHRLAGPAAHWATLSQRIHDEVCALGFDRERRTFTQAYGSKELDASLLLSSILGFLPPRDPRIIGTIDAIERELMVDGFVHRYQTHDDGNVDGMEGHEGAFLACSFWLVDALVLAGRRDEATALFERLLEVRNDVGLLSEEFDPVARRLLGNFPQAFSHVALINSARNVVAAHGPAEERANRAG
jgi:GH15 family glucan-1,4-alpha-glucosidase